MMELFVQGNPTEVLPAAYGALFQLYYSMKETPKGPKQAAPRLRCPGPESTQASNINSGTAFAATIGLPLPDEITVLPQSLNGGKFPIGIADWEYGDTAEILHKGPYDREPPTIKRLLDFIEAQGYAPSGIHEEEYIIGPGVPGAVPEGYVTIIRYPVRKK